MKFDNRTLVLMAAAIVINIVVGQIVAWLEIRLSSSILIGTILVGDPRRPDRRRHCRHADQFDLGPDPRSGRRRLRACRAGDRPRRRPARPLRHVRQSGQDHRLRHHHLDRLDDRRHPDHRLHVRRRHRLAAPTSRPPICWPWARSSSSRWRSPTCVQNLADKIITAVIAWLIATRLPRNFTTGLPFFAYTRPRDRKRPRRRHTLAAAILEMSSPSRSP